MHRKMTEWMQAQRGALALAGLLALPAGAASNEAPVGQVSTSQEIVVTARKWAEPVQQVPGAITVRTADELAATGANDVRVAALDVPNFTLADFTPRALTFPYVRGIGSGQNAPAITTYIDGVPQLSYVTANQELLDVERIEFLRGPQGALYGLNTLGGVINVVPRLPAREPGGNLTLTAGNFNTYEGRGTAEGPLGGSGLFGSLSGGYASRDGYTKNDFTGHDLDSRSARFGRSQIYLPTPGAWDFRLSLTAERDRDGDYALYDLASLRAHPYHAMHDYEGYNDRDLVQPVFTAQRHGDETDFTSITAFQWWQTRASTDLDYTPGDLMREDERERQAAWIQEFRLASATNAPVQLGDRVALHWLVGAYAFDQDFTQHQSTDYRPGGVAYGLWPAPFQMNNDAQLDNYGASLFGQTTFTLDKQWELGLGLRDDFEHSSAKLSSAIPPMPALSSSDPSRNFNQVSPRVSLGYHVTQDALAYAEVAKGYRAGGFNASSPAGHDSYDTETCWNYEAGLKTAWFENRLIANAAVFHTDWRDLQVNSHVPGGSASDYYIENGGKAKSQGAELELTLKPVRGVDFFGGVGLLDAVYLSGSHSADMDVSGNTLPFAPRVNWHAGSQLTAQFSAQQQAYFRCDVVGTGRYYYDPTNFKAQGGYALVNLRLGTQLGAWRIEGWVQNLFDHDYVPLAIPYGQDAHGAPLYVGEMGLPRTLGVSIGRDF